MDAGYVGPFGAIGVYLMQQVGILGQCQLPVDTRSAVRQEGPTNLSLVPVAVVDVGIQHMAPVAGALIRAS